MDIDFSDFDVITELKLPVAPSIFTEESCPHCQSEYWFKRNEDIVTNIVRGKAAKIAYVLEECGCFACKDLSFEETIKSVKSKCACCAVPHVDRINDTFLNACFHEVKGGLVCDCSSCNHRYCKGLHQLFYLSSIYLIILLYRTAIITI